MSAICWACGHENRGGRKFCGACGAAVGVACSACGSGNEAGQHFCGDCGAALPPSAAPVSGAAPRAGAPEPSAERAGERKHITVLFADVQGSMALQESLDPEIWAAITERFVQILAAGVHRFGGTVDTFTGDGIMALFGAPFAQEDHAQRGCHAAWHLSGALRAYAEELRSSGGIELQVRVGLNSGEVLLDRVGEDLRPDATVLGHAVGLARRMESLADPGSIYLSEHTARLVHRWFRLRDLGPRTVKGVREPVGVFVLEGPAAPQPTSRRAGLAASTRLVGREVELAVLNDALARAERGEAQLVGVVGEAGVGKSRLCEEFAELAAARGLTVRRTAGVSHGRQVPLLPVLAMLRDYFGITTAATPAEARAAMTARLLDLAADLEDDLPLLFDFLEIPETQHAAAQVAPEVRMRRVFEVLRRLTARRSERETLVLLAEDLHWFDPQSEVFLERLVESFPGSRTLVVTNFRPEFSARWMRHSYYQQLALHPLGAEALGELLEGLIGDDQSVATVPFHLLERTGGNPFFVEEVIRTLVEDGTLAGRPGAYFLTRPLDRLRLPVTVQAVLAARIDRLPPASKRVLQIASIIGRTFPEPVLARVVGQGPEPLADSLSALCAAELVQQVQDHPVVEYRFWHALTQEVAYGTMLTAARARLHASVAESLADHEGDRLDETAAVLSWHWERAGRPLEAARWSMRAAAFALGSDLSEALRRWRTTIDLVRDDTAAESIELGLRARMRLLQFGARAGIDRREAERLEAEGRALAERLDILAFRGMVEVAAGTARVMTGDLCGARDRYLAAARWGEQTDDLGLRAALWIGPPVAITHIGPLADGLSWSDRALAVCAGDPDRGAAIVGYSPLPRILHLRAGMLARMGRLPEAAADIEHSLALLRARVEPDTLCWTLAMLPVIAWLTGEEGNASASAEEAVRQAEETTNVAALVLALEGLAIAQLIAGRPVDAASTCVRALSEARGRGSGLLEEAGILAHLARARLAAGDLAAAGAAVEEAVTVARRQGGRVLECLALLTRAEVWSGVPGREEGVLDDLAAARTAARETGALTFEPFIEERLGRLRSDLAHLHEAARLYRSVGAGGHHRRLLGEITRWGSAAPSAAPLP